MVDLKAVARVVTRVVVWVGMMVALLDVQKDVLLAVVSVVS